MEQVAEAAGVSKTTVSRVFANPDRVNVRTRDVVLETARDLGYEHRAPRLRSTRLGTIGLVVQDIVNPFFPPMIRAVERRARAAGYGVVLVDSDTQTAAEADALEGLLGQVDGLVLYSPRLAAPRLSEVAALLPVVLVNSDVRGVPVITVTSQDGMRQAVEHLYALGHERCCYVNGPRDMWSNHHRRSAVEEACRELGMAFVEAGPFANTYEAGVQAADIVAASGVTSVIAVNDLVALGIMQRLMSRGIEVPRGISVIGVDDTLLATVSRPQLTTVRIPAEEIGARAVDLVVAQLHETGHVADSAGSADSTSGADASERSPIEIGTQLIVRDSTGTAATSITWPVRPLPA